MTSRPKNIAEYWVMQREKQLQDLMARKRVGLEEV
jgi:hypothetical protein